jgi:hypothetical protein
MLSLASDAGAKKKLATLNDLGVLRHMLCTLLAELNVSVIIFVRELRRKWVLRMPAISNTALH